MKTMVRFRMSKAGWRVIGGAIESGWGPTLRLVFVLLAVALLTMAVLIGIGVVGGSIAEFAGSAV